MCCGRNKTPSGWGVASQPVANRLSAKSSLVRPRPANGAPIAGTNRLMVEYAGRTAMTVVGPVTGTSYRFAFTGARVAVDLRDRPSLLRVPGLRLAQ